MINEQIWHVNLLFLTDPDLTNEIATCLHMYHHVRTIWLKSLISRIVWWLSSSLRLSIADKLQEDQEILSAEKIHKYVVYSIHYTNIVSTHRACAFVMRAVVGQALLLINQANLQNVEPVLGKMFEDLPHSWVLGKEWFHVGCPSHISYCLCFACKCFWDLRWGTCNTSLKVNCGHMRPLNPGLTIAVWLKQKK